MSAEIDRLGRLHGHSTPSIALDPMNQQLTEPKYCVTLVHGTFAPGAPWTKEDSILCRTLATHLDGPARYFTQNWGGGNSPRTRHAAALRLAGELSLLVARFSRAHHFVVAHSHGGNVALMSCGDPRVAARLSGVVCLATPFLSYAPRRVLPVLTLMVFGSLALVIGSVVLGLSASLPFPADAPVDANAFANVVGSGVGAATMTKSGDLFGDAFVRVAQYLGCFGSMLVPVALISGLFWLSRWIVPWMSRYVVRLQQETSAHYRFPSVFPLRLLNVSIPLDEARLWLQGLRLFTEVPFWIYPVLVVTMGVGGLISLAFSGAASSGGDGGWAFLALWVWRLCFSLIMVSGLVAFLSAVCQAALFLTVFLFGSPLGFGWEGWTGSWFGRIRAALEPPLPETVVDTRRVGAADIAADIGGRAVLLRLRHSLLYESPTVARAIAEWMNAQAASARA